MRRRDFISTACGAAASAVVPDRSLAADDYGLTLLLQLARVVIPDETSGAWSNQAPRQALEDKWRSLDSNTRKGYTEVLKNLDRAAVRSGGVKDFASLSPEKRPEIVRRLLEDSKEFKDSFWRMRSMMLYAYYDSPTGMKRTGYYPTTQFEGYPEIDKFPAGRQEG